MQQEDGRGHSTVKTVRGVLCPVFQMAVDNDILMKKPFQFELARLVDTDKNTMSIQNLIRKVKNNAHILEKKQEVLNKIDEFEKTLAESEYISTGIETIKHRRDTTFAHNDKKYFLHPDKDDSHLPMYKIWFIRDFICQVVSYFANVFGVTLEKDTIYNRDLNNLLNLKYTWEGLN